jgi:DNA-binding transcriptional LysR family regulator
VQSAISDQISALEETVGQRLIDRAPGGRRLALTPAALAEGRVVGTLRVGVFPSIAARIGSRLVERFGAARDTRLGSLELEPRLRVTRRVVLVRNRHRRNVPGADEFGAVARDELDQWSART